MLFWSRNLPQERYNSIEPAPKKEIPVKNFEIHESIHLQFRAEAFNLTNTPPFAQPTGQTNFTTSKFTAITSTKNSNENNGARTLQLALKLFY